MTTVTPLLSTITRDAETSFHRSQSVLSFEEYLHEIITKPHAHLRNTARYLSDMVDSFGSYDQKTPAKTLKRYQLFDADFKDGDGKIFGHERVQHEIITHIRNFVRAGRIDKLLLLHGPNGSAKTSIVQAISNALENYSKSDEGAIYHFSWVFPKKENLSGPLGFGQTSTEKLQPSFARLANEAIDAKLASDQRDHPLLLLSQDERTRVFDFITEHGHSDVNVPEVLRTGELSHKNRQIFDALLSTYHGDLAQVLRHIRVERFYFSRRYKRGIAVVEPQMSVDADVRQITSDQSILSLPSALRHLSLFETMGPLVEANRGLIEYSDLLKRPVETWKYLLVACEQAQVSIGSLSIFFDALMIATSNELHLQSFREFPDWPSFKGRIELIRVPYLLRSVDEAGIYHNQIGKLLSHVHIAPHSMALAARWAVLTRLEPPIPENYPHHMQEIIHDLSPGEKLDLYDFGETPMRLSQQQSRELRALIPALMKEHIHKENYEGRFGASPREIRQIILHAAQDSRFDHLSVQAIFSNIEELIENRASYDFLRRESVRGYRDPGFLLNAVKCHYVTILEDEVRNALGLYNKESYLDLFIRYILHVSAWTKKERLFDPLLQRETDADENFMTNIEQRLMAAQESKEDFRRQLISQIGAFKLENPQADLDYKTLFSSHLRRLKEHHYEEQMSSVQKIIRTFLHLSDTMSTHHDDNSVTHALALKKGLAQRGYNETTARLAMAFLLKE